MMRTLSHQQNTTDMCQDRDKKDKRAIQTGFYRPVSLNGNTKSDQFRDAGRF